MDFEDKKHEAENKLMEWIEKKQIKPAEDIINGLENTPKALIGLLNGENKGKRMVKIIK
jgi:NADPH-dependent curcumin reductase CurA